MNEFTFYEVLCIEMKYSSICLIKIFWSTGQQVHFFPADSLTEVSLNSPSLTQSSKQVAFSSVKIDLNILWISSSLYFSSSMNFRLDLCLLYRKFLRSLPLLCCQKSLSPTTDFSTELLFSNYCWNPKSSKSKTGSIRYTKLWLC